MYILCCDCNWLLAVDATHKNKELEELLLIYYY
jgi:hypothetical protein